MCSFGNKVRSLNSFSSYEHRRFPTLMSTKELVELNERRRFMESFLRLQYVYFFHFIAHYSEFYRKNYPLDSELVTELR